MMYELINVDESEIEILDACPWCNNANNKIYKEFEILQLSKCKTCNLIYTSKRVLEKFINKYYGIEYIKDHSDASLLENSKHIPYYEKQLKRIEKLNGKKGKLLDIGYGGGIFSITAKRLGFEVISQDISKEIIENLKKSYNIEGYYGKLEDIKFGKNSFDVIVINHALEHIYDLHLFLNEINNIIRINGIVSVLLPNMFSIDCMFNRNNFKINLSLPFHNYHFKQRTFSKVMKMKGFKIILTDHSISNIFSLIIKFRTLFKKIVSRRTQSVYHDNKSIGHKYANLFSFPKVKDLKAHLKFLKNDLHANER